MTDPNVGLLGLSQAVDWIVGGVALMLSGLGWFWAYLHGHFKDIRTEIKELDDTKSELSEMERARNNLEKVFDRLDVQAQSLARIEATLLSLPKRKGDQEQDR